MRETREPFVETIVACATPPGEGAIAIVRISGRDAPRIVERLAPGRGAVASHRLSRVGLITHEGKALDDALVVEMRAPRSYTGEDMAELHLHGARSVVAAAIESCVAVGARLARPGEFTLRAFLNGRLDLAQAEAVGDLIASETEAERLAANAQLAGSVSAAVGGLVAQVEGVLARWRAALDFPEYDTPLGWTDEDRRVLEETRNAAQRLLDLSGIRLASGWSVVLCGAPNVGKSTLLNALVGEERALVHDEPGTTRDAIEVALVDGLIRWSLCDTAGIREGADELEARGIGVARRRAADADLVVWLLGADAPEWPPDNVGSTVLVVGSKADLSAVADRRRIEAEASRRGLEFGGWVSGRDGEGVAALRRRLSRVETRVTAGSSAMLLRRRHADCLRRAVAALGSALAGIAGGAELDLCATDLEDAGASLGEILGRDVDGAVLDRIFAEFCIGK